jgi:hypothetical protein
LCRDAAAVDDAARAAVHGQRRLVAKIDRIRFRPKPVWSASSLIQVAVPKFPHTRARVVADSAGPGGENAKPTMSGATMPCSPKPVNDGETAP